MLSLIMAFPWILLAVLVAVVLLAVVAVIFYRKKKHVINYKRYFHIGIIWTAFGVVSWLLWDSFIFLILGIPFLAVGLANKDKWGKNVELTEKQRKIMLALIILGIILLAVGILAFELFV